MTETSAPATETLSPSIRRCGYVALLGRPNAGKSTLLNAVLGHKIAVVSAKPQTTRNRILGVHTEGDSQVLFLDTPGIHRAESLHRINRTMNRVAWNVLVDADVVCYLVDSTEGWQDEDSGYLQGILQRTSKPVYVLATKIDAIKKDAVALGAMTIDRGLRGVIDSLPEDKRAAAESQILTGGPVRVSSKRPESVAEFRSSLLPLMPEGPFHYAEDDLTDMPQQFVCAEIVREQVFRQMGAEIPYNVAVKIDSFKHEKTITKILATIILQKDSHKGMIIGRGGARLKSIGTEARIALERHLERKVYLELFVKVAEGWIDSDALIAEYAGLVDPKE
ncbi:MAG: GTPase Era [Silvanigrellales bacterium]|jgi:GTP-binding protein Era|nr:GTPase Era [Silvanigrellales bacterium]